MTTTTVPHLRVHTVERPVGDSWTAVPHLRVNPVERPVTDNWTAVSGIRVNVVEAGANGTGYLFFQDGASLLKTSGGLNLIQSPGLEAKFISPSAGTYYFLSLDPDLETFTEQETVVTNEWDVVTVTVPEFWVSMYVSKPKPPTQVQVDTVKAAMISAANGPAQVVAQDLNIPNAGAESGTSDWNLDPANGWIQGDPLLGNGIWYPDTAPEGSYFWYAGQNINTFAYMQTTNYVTWNVADYPALNLTAWTHSENNDDPVQFEYWCYDASNNPISFQKTNSFTSLSEWVYRSFGPITVPPNTAKIKVGVYAPRTTGIYVSCAHDGLTISSLAKEIVGTPTELTIVNKNGSSGSTTGWTVTSAGWTARTSFGGFGPPGYGEPTDTHFWQPGTAAFASMYQDVTLPANQDKMQIFWCQGSWEALDTGNIRMEFYDNGMSLVGSDGGPGLAAINTSPSAEDGHWISRWTDKVAIPATATKVRIILEAEKNSGTNGDALIGDIHAYTFA